MLFTPKRWFAKRKSTVDRPGRARRPSPAPRLEALEDRCCPSGIAFVQNIGTASQAGAISSLTIPVPTAVTAGDSVVVEYASTAAHGAATVTDSGGNTYTIAAGSGTEGSNGELIYIASGVHAIAAGGTITVSFPSTTATDSTVASAAEFAGLSDTNPVDSSGETMNYNPPGNTTPSASVSTNQANDLLIGSISPYNAGGGTPPTFTPGSGYTALTGTSAANPANSAVALDLEYQVVSGAGTYAVGGTFNSTSTSDVAVAAFREGLTAVTNLTPPSGPAAGGTSVTITGSDFSGATAVDFGTTPASSFTVNSATSITAVSPAGTGTVDVTVTTPIGTSATSAADQFTFTAAVTPPTPVTPATNPSPPPALSPNAAYVANCYQLLLGRGMDPGAQGWVNLLNAGASPASIVQGIEATPEFLTDVVKGLYQHYLDRPGSPGEWASWEHLLAGGATVEQVTADFLTSPEYTADHGSNLGFVQGLYQGVLARPGSASEWAPWVGALNTGAASRAEVALAFLTSPEYRADLVAGGAFDYGPLWGGFYAEFLKRPAEPAGLAPWMAALQTGATDQAVLAGILGSPEGYRIWS